MTVVRCGSPRSAHAVCAARECCPDVDLLALPLLLSLIFPDRSSLICSFIPAIPKAMIHISFNDQSLCWNPAWLDCLSTDQHSKQE